MPGLPYGGAGGPSTKAWLHRRDTGSKTLSPWVKYFPKVDVLLVERGLQESRQKAQATIMSGLVFINGQRADKPGTPVAEDAAVEIRGSTLRYVSRGMLARALAAAWASFPAFR